MSDVCLDCDSPYHARCPVTTEHKAARVSCLPSREHHVITCTCGVVATSKNGLPGTWAAFRNHQARMEEGK